MITHLSVSFVAGGMWYSMRSDHSRLYPRHHTSKENTLEYRLRKWLLMTKGSVTSSFVNA